MDTVQANQGTSLRLSLLDLFIWTTLAALTCALWTIQTANSGAGSVNVTQWLFFVPTALAFATSGTVLALFARRRYRRLPIDFQPGHWLFCLTGVVFLYHALALLVTSAILNPMSVSGVSWMTWYLRIGQDVGFLTAFLLTGFLLPVRPMWRLVLVMPCVMSLLSIIGVTWWLVTENAVMWLHLLRLEIVVVVVGLLVLLSIAAWDKATTRDRRDMLHWLGVVTVVLLNSPPILIRLYEAWFR